MSSEESDKPLEKVAAPSRSNDGAASSRQPQLPPSGSRGNSANRTLDESKQGEWRNQDYWWRLQQATWQLIEIIGLKGTSWRLAMLVLTSMSLDADAEASDFTTRDLADRLVLSPSTISRAN